MGDSIDDSIRRALEAHEEGVSSADLPTLPLKGAVSEEPTVQAQRPAGSMSGSLGALPGHSVERLIARGGMGAVYLARQEALERDVAVKVMTANAESPEMAARFRREALVLGQLAHPNIVPVYDVGTTTPGGVHEVLEVDAKGGRFRADFTSEEDKVFVFGRQVSDFRTVDYQAIAMLNVSATQELDRKVEVKDTEIEALKRQVAAQGRQLAELKARDRQREAREKEREERLARLEQLVH